MNGTHDHNAKCLEINYFFQNYTPPPKKNRSSCNGSDLFNRKVPSSNNGRDKHYYIFATFVRHCRKTAGGFLNQTNLVSVLYVPGSSINHKNTLFKEANKCTLEYGCNVIT
jgi:hypothetical protein